MARAIRFVGVSSFVVACAAFSACGGDEFGATPGAGGEGGDGPGVGGSAGKRPDAGRTGAGDAGESNGSLGGGASGEGNAGGTAGAPPVETCSAPATLEDLAALRFGEPEALSVVNDTADLENLRFARVAPVGTALIYTRDFFGSHIWVTLDPAASAGAAVAPPLAANGLYESGALVLPGSASGLLDGFNIFFQRTVGENSMQLELLGGRWALTGTVMDVERLPSPFNAPPATVPWSYGIAIGKDRVLWTVNTDGILGTKLQIASLSAMSEPKPLELTLPNGCPVREIDFAPWLTMDGRTLFFTSRYRDEMCDLEPGDRTAIFVINLDDDGNAIGDSIELAGLGGEAPPAGASFTDGSLSPDHCWIYYSALNEALPHLRLFRAHRLD